MSVDLRLLQACWPFALTNALIIAFVGALIYGGWTVYAVLGLAILMGGAMDEAVGDSEQRPAERGWLFFDINLYATLPLLVVITYLMFRNIAGGASDSLGGTRLAGVPVAPAPLVSIMAVGYFYALAGVTVAHELTHRVSNPMALIWARFLLAFTLNPTFETYHLHGHHRNVGTYHDASTARRGEYVLAFVARTVACQFIEAWRLEADRLARNNAGTWSWHNRVLVGMFCVTVILAGAAVMAGSVGMAAFLGAAIFGRILHEMVNYVQHYGIVRAEGAPIDMRHSWDCGRFISNALQYNLPRHADHHIFGSKPFWKLNTVLDSPKLPHGYQTMSLIALHQPSWRKLIDPLLADWDQRLANDIERSLIRERGWTIESGTSEPASGQSRNRRSLPCPSAAQTELPPH
jgi:hypothetical protein